MKPISMRQAGPGPVVVLLHSSGSSGRQWDVLRQRLHDRFRVRAIDVHGHGATPAWLAGRPLQLEDDMALVEPHLGDGPVHLVGHSYGGVLALKLALRFSQQVSSVAVYEPVLLRLLLEFNRRDPAATSMTQTARSMANWVAVGDPARAAERFVDFWSGPGSWQALAPRAQATIAARISAVLGHFHAIFSDTTSRADWQRLTMPLLYLTGSRTTSTARRVTELMRRFLPQGVHETMPGLGHMGPITHAEVVATRIADFLDARGVSANDEVALPRAA